MWGGVAIAALGVLVIMPFSPVLGQIMLAASVPTSLTGAWFKKKYCPRCRADSGPISGRCQADACSVEPESPTEKPGP